MNDNEKNKLMEDIENIVRRHRMNYIDAMVYYCEKFNIDIENIVSSIPSSLKSKLEQSAKEMKLLKKEYSSKGLPI